MSFSADDILNRIMDNATTGLTTQGGSALKRYHVSQTADQLPDFKVRNSYYRAELERQIQEKREAERRRREKEILEEERLLRRIEEDREKVRREYLEEIEKRRIMQEDAVKRQQSIARKLEEIEERKRAEEEEENRRRQQAVIEKRLADLKEAVEKRKSEERRQRILYEQLYTNRFTDDNNRAIAPIARYGLNLSSESDFYKRPWNSRDYVHSALTPDLALEDVYFDTPLPVLADVYKKLDTEKKRIKEIMRQRIIQGENNVY